MRLTAFFNLYKICILLHRCNLKILAKIRFGKSAIFVKIQQHFGSREARARCSGWGRKSESATDTTDTTPLTPYLEFDNFGENL